MQQQQHADELFERERREALWLQAWPSPWQQQQPPPHFSDGAWQAPVYHQDQPASAARAPGQGDWEPQPHPQHSASRPGQHPPLSTDSEPLHWSPGCSAPDSPSRFQEPPPDTRASPPIASPEPYPRFEELASSSSARQMESQHPSVRHEPQPQNVAPESSILGKRASADEDGAVEEQRRKFHVSDCSGSMTFLATSFA
jgi:hypothetical protein